MSSHTEIQLLLRDTNTADNRNGNVFRIGQTNIIPGGFLLALSSRSGVTNRYVPIGIRQHVNNFQATGMRELMLMDVNGNTSIPGD